MTMLLTGRAQSTLLNQIHHCDLFTLCDWLYEAGIRVDMILADLPYAQTQSVWDVLIPFEPMWERFKRVLKPRGAVVLTATQPFTSKLTCSNLEMFRYEWVWDKVSPVGHLNAQLRPMQRHESVLVFSEGREAYYPQLRKNVTTPFGKASTSKQSVYGASGKDYKVGVGYPLSILSFVRPNNLTTDGNLHPNQKPVALFEYLIRTYTRAGDLVLDPCVGSGTTALAARNTQRQYVCGDSSAKYVQVARNRLAMPYTLPLFAEATA